MRGSPLAAYCLIAALVSAVGGFVPLVLRLTHARVQVLTSAVAGFMLGVALLHLFPEAAATSGAHAAATWMLAGMLAMFFLERFLPFHHHEVIEVDRDRTAGHVASCGEAPHGHVHVHEHRLSWAGAAVGLGFHSLIAGATLAAATRADGGAGGAALPGALPGAAVFLMIVFHQPFDSMTLVALMTTSGQSRAARHLANALFALAVPAGAALFLLGVGGDVSHHPATATALAFSAGVFLSIALADLLPEIRFHAHDKLSLTTALLAGVALSWLSLLLEGGH